jgi:hypothetical protein
MATVRKSYWEGPMTVVFGFWKKKSALELNSIKMSWGPHCGA